MRADAARNLRAVLLAGARLLTDDPQAGMAEIAAAAGVDRRTVYRHFESRDDLLRAVYRARLDAYQQLIEESRLSDTPVLVALRRYCEGGVALAREWPIDLERMFAEPTVQVRRTELNALVDAFLQRAVDEGVLRSDLPPGWATQLLRSCLRTAALSFPHLPEAQAADLVVQTLLRGIGA